MVAVSSQSWSTTSSATTQKMPTKIVSFCRRVRIGFIWHPGSDRPRLEPRGVYDAVVHFEVDKGQWPPRRARDRSAAFRFEGPVVTRAVEFSAVQVRDHGACQVRALLAKRDELARPQAEGEARLMLVRITELDHPLLF